MASPISNSPNTTPSPTDSQSSRSDKLDSSTNKEAKQNIRPETENIHSHHDHVNLSRTGLNLNVKSIESNANGIKIDTPNEAADLAANVGRFIRENAAQALQAQTGNFDNDFIKLLK